MLRRHILHRARAYATLIAVGVSLATLTIGIILSGMQTLERRRELIKGGERIVVQLQTEVNATFDRLQATDPELLCTESALIGLRGILIDQRHIREIGMYDQAGRLFCTTAMGRLGDPFFEPPSDLINSSGQIIWRDVPLLSTKGATQAMVIRDGDFNVALDPEIRRHLIMLRGIDAIWLVAGRRVVPVAINPEIDPQLVAELSARAKVVSGEELEWNAGRLIVTRKAAASDYAIQSAIEPHDVLEGLEGLSIPAFLLILSIALLTYQASLPRLRAVHSVRRRLPALIDEAHIHCTYQPIVELASGEVVGCEVLMRLRDADELICPDRVIPWIIEQGLAWRLDQIVSCKAIDELRRILPTDRPFKVAFNFFPCNLARPEFKRHLNSLRSSIGSNVALNVEVTEYSFAPESIAVLNALKADGYLVSVDDFGTGYSNLGSIKRVSPDFLKIDKSFVFEMEDASLRSNLIPEIVALGRAVGADLIAEGIENERQAQSLARMGIRYGQGYFFSRPVPVQELIAWIARRRAGPVEPAVAEEQLDSAEQRRNGTRLTLVGGKPTL